MTDEVELDVVLKPTEPHITVDYGKGRWAKVFHLFDRHDSEIVLHQKEAVLLAKSILKIAKEK